MTGNNQRLTVLDALRGIAAFGVLLFHLSPYFPLGHYGVHLFFIISGFVIFNSVEKLNRPTDFLIKRFFRLYPTYWVCLLLTILFIYFGKNYTWIELTPKKILFNFTMVQEIFGVKNIDTSYWTLLVELFFYGFIFLLLVTKQLKNIIVIGFAWLGIILLNLIFSIEDHFQFIKVFNVRHGALFFTGILFNRIFNGKNEFINHFGILCCFVLSVLIYPITQPKVYSMGSHIPVMFFIYLVFYLFVNGQMKFLSNSVLLFLGRISYPLYLLHQVIGLLIISLLKDKFHFSFPLALLFSILSIIFISWLVQKYVEIPVIRMAKSFTKKMSIKPNAITVAQNKI